MDGTCARYSTVISSAVGGTLFLILLFALIWRVLHTRAAGASRRLIGAGPGTAAGQRDLPAELRSKYEAVAVLGSGSFGVVIEAWQLSSGRRAARRAVKLVHAAHSTFTDKELRRLERECMLMSQLADERFLVKYVDSGKSQGRDVYWCVMEYLDGLSMDRVLEMHGPMGELQAVKLGLDICSALKALHHKGVIHRDVKPANIFRIDNPVTSGGGGGGGGNGLSRRGSVMRTAGTGAVNLNLKGNNAFSSVEMEASGTMRTACRAEPKSKGFWPFSAGASVEAPPAIATVRRRSVMESRVGEVPTSGGGGRGGHMYKLIDLGAAIGIEVDETKGSHQCLMTLSALDFGGTPAYAAPENFTAPDEVSYSADLWSLAVTLFHLVSGTLPFDCSSVAAAAASIADPGKEAPDVRDAAAAERRAEISSAFAAVVARGLSKTAGERYVDVDEMATDLYGCLVQRGEGMYTAFVSYRAYSEKFHAMLLYDVLNNTITPAGNRVIVYLDAKRLVKGEDWEQGFAVGLINSLVAIPLLSRGFLEPMARLTGALDDPEDNVAKEVLIMHALLDANSGGPVDSADGDNSDEGGGGGNGGGGGGKLVTIYPVLVGQPYPEGNAKHPNTGNFFTDGSNAALRRIVDAQSPPTHSAAARFLAAHGAAPPKRTVAQAVKDLFAVQGAQLWSHGVLTEEEIPADSDIACRLEKDAPDPPLSLAQLRAVKAEFRALVPGIHEVIDRAHDLAAARGPVSKIQKGGSGVERGGGVDGNNGESRNGGGSKVWNNGSHAGSIEVEVKDSKVPVNGRKTMSVNVDGPEVVMQWVLMDAAPGNGAGKGHDNGDQGVISRAVPIMQRLESPSKSPQVAPVSDRGLRTIVDAAVGTTRPAVELYGETYAA